MKIKSIQKQKYSIKEGQPALVKAPNRARWSHYGALAIILLITLIIYLPMLQNGFVWDDEQYIQNNSLIHSFNIKKIFTQFVEGNYHPLTILTLALEYQFFGLNEIGYHAVNLFFHLFNVVLVFYVVFHLSNEVMIAWIASLLFGIHPMHVESVAWATELKDLLYTFFFLGSYIFYLKYLMVSQRRFYIFALLLFLAALLSKAMAVSLPVVILLTDFFIGRKINWKNLIEKTPFFILAFTFGVVALFAQKASNSIQDIEIFTFPQHIVFACYGFMSYLFKLILPLHLSAFYPYPVKGADGIPISYYAYGLLFICFMVSVFYSLRFTKKIFFGVGFFTVTVFLVLQLLPVGGAIMADRYTYLPSIGIFYLAGVGFNVLWTRKLKWFAMILISVFAVFFAVKTHARCGVWKNGMTLWNDVIRQYQTVPQAYYNRGTLFMKDNKNDEAFKDFSKALELKPDYAEAYNNRGTLLMKVNKNEEALRDFNKGIELDQKFVNAYYNRGTLFMNVNKSEEARRDFNIAIALKSDYYKAYNNLGVIFSIEKNYTEAINHFSKAIEFNAKYAEAYRNRGMAEFYLGRKDAACSDLKKASGFRDQRATELLTQICK